MCSWVPAELRNELQHSNEENLLPVSPLSEEKDKTALE